MFQSEFLFPDYPFGKYSNNCFPRDRYFINSLLAAGRKALATKWLVNQPPVKKNWARIVEEIYRIKKLQMFLNFRMEQFHKYWRIWENYDECNST